MLIILLWLKKLRKFSKNYRKCEVNNRVKITKNKNIFSKGNTEYWSREIFIIDSVLKINPWNYKL